MNHDARNAIEAITSAMSSLSGSSLQIDGGMPSIVKSAHDHLREARRLLIAKYQPNTEEIGR